MEKIIGVYVEKPEDKNIEKDKMQPIIRSSSSSNND